MADAQAWLRASAAELAQLLGDQGRTDEPAIQRWLERHPAFVPGSRGPDGMSGWPAWPGALISQPPLTGIVAKIPDFCWLAADSVNLTAVLVEIETPAKPWQQERKAVAAAELTQAREQLVAWRAWFSNPLNQAGFLNDYLVPDAYRDLSFRQHYVLIHGSRNEYRLDRVRARQRAAGMAAPDETLMSYDRLLEITDPRSAGYGCVRREGPGYTAVAVPPTWDPEELGEDARRCTRGYEQAVPESEMAEPEKQRLLEILRQGGPEQPPPYRFQHPRDSLRNPLG